MTKQEVVLVVDRSGSMHGKEADTVGGINTALDELRKTKSETDTVLISIKLFDHEEQLLIRSVDLDNVSSFKREDFVPRGSTSLRDAMGHTLTHFMEKKLRDPMAYDSCVIYVATDGLENTSMHFSVSRLKDLIKNAEKSYNIQFLYLGANQDAILEAGRLGIEANRAMNYSETHGNVEAAYRGLASATTRARTAGTQPSFLPSERHASMESPL